MIFRTGVLVVCLVASVAEPGSAATVSVGQGNIDGAAIVFVAAPGEANNVQASVEAAGNFWTVSITDLSGGLVAGAGCSQLSSTEASCEGEFLFQLFIDLGDGDDALTASLTGACELAFRGYTDEKCLQAVGGAGDDHLVGTPSEPDSLSGGDGDDVLEGRGGYPYCEREIHEFFLCFPEELHGGPGDDVLRGGLRADRLSGGPGTDILRGGLGLDGLQGEDGEDILIGGGGADFLDGGADADADSISGGPDADAADYSDRMLALSLTLDDLANDGEAGEGDNVGSDVEIVYGGRGSNRLIGNERRNVIFGNNGEDRIRGGGGNDTLTGSSGADLLVGGPGDDLLDPGAGRDRARGNAGMDRFRTRDFRRDVLDGGAGEDRATIDPRDYTTRIETIRLH